MLTSVTGLVRKSLFKASTVSVYALLLVGCGDENAVSNELSKRLKHPDTLETQNWAFTEKLYDGRRWACVDYIDGDEPGIAMAYRTKEGVWVILDLDTTRTACGVVHEATRLLGSMSGLPGELVDSSETVLGLFNTPEKAQSAKIKLK